MLTAQDVIDTISDAIGDSMDVDWTYSDGAKAIMLAFQREGWVVMQNTASIPPADTQNDIREAAAEVAEILRSDDPMMVMEGALERLETALGVKHPPEPVNPPRPSRDLDWA